MSLSIINPSILSSLRRHVCFKNKIDVVAFSYHRNPSLKLTSLNDILKKMKSCILISLDPCYSIWSYQKEREIEALLHPHIIGTSLSKAESRYRFSDKFLILSTIYGIAYKSKKASIVPHPQNRVFIICTFINSILRYSSITLFR